VLQTRTTDAHGLAAVCVRHGLIPCSPHNPSLAITIRTIEIYRIFHLRCPRLSILAFIRGIHDLQLKAPATHLIDEQFSIAFDLYSAIRREVRGRIMKALGRDAPEWRLRHACPCCLYRLKEEKKLRFTMLLTMDGNNSAKRIPRRRENDEGATISIERLDERLGGEGYFLLREEIERWANEVTSSVHSKVCVSVYPDFSS
jgi:hypothetical protein